MLRDTARLKNKPIGPLVALILLALVILLALDIGFWLERRASYSEAASASQLVVTVGAPATGVVVDPSGSTTSKSPLSEKSADIIRIPKLQPGEYSLILRGISNGESHFVIQALSGGQPAFSYIGSANVTSGSEWLVRLHVEVLDGLVQDIRVVGYTPAAPSTDRAAPRPRGEETVSSAIETVRSTILRGIGQAERYMANQWATVGSMLFLVLVLVVIWKKR